MLNGITAVKRKQCSLYVLFPYYSSSWSTETIQSFIKHLSARCPIRFVLLSRHEWFKFSLRENAKKHLQIVLSTSFLSEAYISGFRWSGNTPVAYSVRPLVKLYFLISSTAVSPIEEPIVETKVVVRNCSFPFPAPDIDKKILNSFLWILLWQRNSSRGGILKPWDIYFFQSSSLWTSHY